MTGSFGLNDKEVELILSVLKRHAGISGAILFGSRAKSTAAQASDVDLALLGTEDGVLAEEIAAELDELPLPYRFDVVAFSRITHIPLREHIERVGIRIY